MFVIRLGMRLIKDNGGRSALTSHNKSRKINEKNLILILSTINLFLQLQRSSICPQKAVLVTVWECNQTYRFYLVESVILFTSINHSTGWYVVEFQIVKDHAVT